MLQARKLSLAAGFLTFVALSAGAVVPARQAVGPVPATRVFLPERSGVSPALWELPFVKLYPGSQLFEVQNDPDQEEGKQPIDFGVTPSPDGALQDFYSPLAIPAPVQNFQGLSQATQGAVSGFFVSPPDTVGDVGPNHYVQCVNLACQIFSKVGAPIGPVFTIKTIFASLGGQCSITNDGDPIVLYDPLADRWLLSQFSVANRPPAHECVAISQTPDPTGAYNLYDFVIPDDYFNDYPHLGVWPDAYYMTAPLFEGPVFGQGAFAMNRAKMIAGDPTAELVFFDLTVSFPGLHRILPADIDGPAPPPGTPNYMVSTTADEFGDFQDGVRILETVIDWSAPLTSTITEIPFAGGSLAVAAFDPTFTEVSGNCGFAFTSRDDLEQPAPANCGMRIDALGDRPLHRLAYRNSGAYESLVFVQTVDVNATPPTATSGHRAGVRYYELRRALPGGGFVVQEQATYSPDATHRSMGSGALDAAGNLAVGFTATDAATFPGVRYAGRLAGDPPGGLFQGEGIFAAGGRSQTSTGSRWGDYSALSVDPSDDCTFWFTQEYYDPVAPPACSATACWTTRISSFAFPGCLSTTQTGTLQGVVSDFNTALPVAGAIVQANGYSALTNAGGAYTMVLPVGTYTVTAARSGYNTGSISGVGITNGGTTVRHFALTSGQIAGTITDSTSASPIAGAQIAISPGPTVLSNGSGNYAANVGAGTYSVTASAPGYFSATHTGVVVGNAGTNTQNFALVPSPILAVTDTVVDDTAFGNASGGIDPDECFTLLVTLTNSGSVAATAVVGTLSTTTPGVTISGAASNYPDIAPAGSGTNVVAFDISTDGTLPLGAPIDFVLTVATSTGTLPVSFTMSPGAPQQSPSAMGPVPIPDNLGTGASLSVPVAGFSGTLTKVAVRARISHTFSGDLVLRLIGPDATAVILAYQVGGAAAGFGSGACPAPTYTEFDDEAATFIYDGAGPFNGAFKPQETLTAFSGKSGVQVNGSWVFQAVDIGAADTGNIECIQLVLNGVTVSTPCDVLFLDGFETGSTIRWSAAVP
ncbi:MAG: carboxypeptidase regulatory-like domain-containing protein [Thermoanaerobaculia bacterium]